MFESGPVSRIQGRARRVVYLLVAIDIAFIGLDVASRAAVAEPGRLLLTTDRGYAEAFQYLKILWIALLLGSVAVRTRELVLYVWTLVFGYLLLDDALRIHETIGGDVCGDVLQQLSLTAAGDVYKMGQNLFAVIVGGLILASILVAARVSSEAVRRVSNDLLALLIVFAFFSVFLDAAGTWLDLEARSIVEDGGEMLAMSVIAGFALSVRSQVVTSGLDVNSPGL
ncbi:MAG: hypothetical protein QNJ89_13155 [Acidimicrobiia bacterium]|nr:hypothetical protein [Acidimicrobiia bacterium]